MPESIADRVKKIVAEFLVINVSRIEHESSFVDDLGADSLDLAELTMLIEEAFRIDIPDEDAENMLTVGDVIAWLAERVS